MAERVFQNGEFTKVRSRKETLRKRSYLQSGWPFLFAFLCISFYCHAASRREAAVLELSSRLDQMKREKKAICEMKEDLELRLRSQDDSQWIEMILMRELGVVPEGWVKVHFTR